MIIGLYLLSVLISYYLQRIFLKSIKEDPTLFLFIVAFIPVINLGVSFVLFFVSPVIMCIFELIYNVESRCSTFLKRIYRTK
jgi:hypothetical protein